MHHKKPDIYLENLGQHAGDTHCGYIDKSIGNVLLLHSLIALFCSDSLKEVFGVRTDGLSLIVHNPQCLHASLFIR